MGSQQYKYNNKMEFNKKHGGEILALPAQILNNKFSKFNSKQ